MEPFNVVYIAIGKINSPKPLVQYLCAKSQKEHLSAFENEFQELLNSGLDKKAQKSSTLGDWYLISDEYSICFAALVQPAFPAGTAYSLLEEVQERIYSQYPKIMSPDEDEPLTGAKMYISEIAQKYNTLTSQDRERADPKEVVMDVHDNAIASPQKKVEDLGVKVKQSFNLLRKDYEDNQRKGARQFQGVTTLKDVTTDSGEVVLSSAAIIRRRILFIAFICASVLYILVPIIYNASQ